MKIIFFGAPGVGKGTQSNLVAKELNIPTISTGNLLRSEVKAGTELGKKAGELMAAGALVPDDLVIDMLKQRMSEDDCKNGYILDGFPRTTEQANALSKMGVDIDIVISLEVPDETVVDRLSQRRACNKCGATYHLTEVPSKAGDDCEVCGDALIVRHDDKPEVIKARLETFANSTAPVKEHYAKLGVYCEVDGFGNVEETFAKVMKAIEMRKAY